MKHHRKFLLAGIAPVASTLAILALVFVFVVNSVGAAPATAAAHVANGRHALGIRGHVPAVNESRTSTPKLRYHGGPVMQAQEVSYAIFWEPSGWTVSSTYNSLIERWFGDVGGSVLYNNNTQYYQVVSGTRQHIVNKSSLGAAWIDTAAYPASGCTDTITPKECLTDAQIQAEVTHAISVNGWTAGLNHEFFVFTAKNVGSCFDSSSTTCAFSYYCAYHGNYTSGGSPVIYANMPYTGTDLTACGVSTTPNNDIDADSTINVTSHEQMESVTDPEPNSAWADSSGAEIGDKCAWMFGSLTLDGNKANVQFNGHFYIVQQEFDNKVDGCVLKGP